MRLFVALFRRDPAAALDALVKSGDLRVVGWDWVPTDFGGAVRYRYSSASTIPNTVSTCGGSR